MFGQLLGCIRKRPEPYAPGEPEFWTDAHISKGMLEAHLDPELDLATRKPEFVSRSADWIAQCADPVKRPCLLDLGCGPGIYAEQFKEKGFDVTGMDFSSRAIAYAREHAAAGGLDIQYILQNYLELEFSRAFDVAVMIYCDYGVLSGEDRRRLLRSVRRALRPGGMFFVDVCSEKQYEDERERKTWSYSEGGFWSPSPHACLYSFCRYDECRTYLEQYTVITEERVRCYHIWNHAFVPAELEDELKEAGLGTVRLYGDAAGAGYSAELKTICAVAVCD